MLPFGFRFDPVAAFFHLSAGRTLMDFRDVVEAEALQEKKHQNGEHLSGLKHGLPQRFAHHAAHRFSLAGDHRHQLALRSALEVGFREPHHPRNQRVAQPPQHPFGQNICHRIDAHLEQAVHKH